MRAATETLCSMLSASLDLEDLDAIAGSVDELPASLDSRQWISDARYRGAVGPDHALATATGPRSRRPVVDIMATGGLAAGLDSFARGFGNATGDLWDLTEAGLEHLPWDVFSGATLGPMFDTAGKWTVNQLGLEDVADGLLRKVAGQAWWELFF